MVLTGRYYLCVCCHTPVLVCSLCDRGNRYCTGNCANLERIERQREAGKRYQQSPKGRIRHAKRQFNYRARQKIVTHQTPPLPTPSDLLPPIPTLCKKISSPLPDHCHFCGRPLDKSVRYVFLHHRIRRPYVNNRRKQHHDYSP